MAVGWQLLIECTKCKGWRWKERVKEMSERKREGGEKKDGGGERRRWIKQEMKDKLDRQKKRKKKTVETKKKQ